MLRSREVQAIKKIVQDRNILYLVHFTRIENLDSIFIHGLYPRQDVDTSANDPDHPLYDIPEPVTNDKKRADYKRNYNCLSISFPNDSLFYKHRTQQGGNWGVLLLNPSILWEKECLFYSMNAACHIVNQRPIHIFSTASALENMFLNNRYHSRESYLKPCDPTNVQAEVMVKGIIEPEYIMHCLFNDKVIAADFNKDYTGMHYLKEMYNNRNYVRKNEFGD